MIVAAAAIPSSALEPMLLLAALAASLIFAEASLPALAAFLLNSKNFALPDLLAF